MKTILFICEYNACRSQMAEGLARKYLPDYQIYSAGLYPGALHEMTLQVMQEVGIDLSSQRSKLLKEITDLSFDTVVILAREAWEPSAIIRGKERLEWFLPDPAKTEGDRETILEAMRQVRDILEQKIGGLKG